MKYVTCFGALYHLTEKQFKTMIKDYLANPAQGPDCSAGKMLANPTNITDWTEWEAQQALKKGMHKNHTIMPNEH